MCHADLQFSLKSGFERHPRARRIANVSSSKVAGGHGGNVRINWCFGRHLPKQEHTPLASSAFPQAR